MQILIKVLKSCIYHTVSQNPDLKSPLESTRYPANTTKRKLHFNLRVKSSLHKHKVFNMPLPQNPISNDLWEVSSPINKMVFPLYLGRRRWKGGTITQVITTSTAMKR